MNIPKKLTAWGGIDALVHAIESYVSVAANDYTRGLSLQAIRLIFEYLPRAYHLGAQVRVCICVWGGWAVVWIFMYVYMCVWRGGGGTPCHPAQGGGPPSGTYKPSLYPLCSG